LQKRASEERQEWVRSANKDLLLRLLPILDTLNLAQKHIQNDGLKVSIAQFLDTLKTEGVTKIEAVGKDFDPHLMECITTEEGKENKVLEEMREGYMLYDKVLRAAQVKVGRK
jgi:molecular chaperone GrpE